MRCGPNSAKLPCPYSAQATRCLLGLPLHPCYLLGWWPPLSSFIYQEGHAWVLSDLSEMERCSLIHQSWRNAL